MTKTKKTNQKKYNEYRKNYKYKTRYGGLRNMILERDNYSCVECGMNNEQHIVIFGRSITIDHIDGNGIYSNNPNNSIENLQTLCLRCHGLKDQKRRIYE
jgi:5-methylcytosine-specific restriction endonuclease McrA